MSGGSSLQKLIVATRNQHKVAELSSMLAASGLDVEVLSLEQASRLLGRELPPDTIEDAPDFQGNAAKKAREVAAWAGLPAMADDSGLEVDAVGGEPGVYSARYAQDEWPAGEPHGSRTADRINYEKLLRKLRDVPDAQRTGRFRCAVAVADPRTGEVIIGDGRCEGTILHAPRGDGGFGYDPLFYVPELGLTFAESPRTEKDKVSHRARAVADLLPRLTAYFRGVPG